MTYKAVDHLGTEYLCISEMCMHYGISSKLFLKRLRWEWTLEEALTVPENAKEYINENGRIRPVI